MNLRIDSINYIDSQLNQKKLKEWSNEFLGKYKKYKKVSEKVKSIFSKEVKDEFISVSNEDLSNVVVEISSEAEFGSTNDAFMYAEGVLKRTLRIVFSIAGYEKKGHFNSIHDLLSERDVVYKTRQKLLPEQPLDDIRWLIKVLQRSRFLTNLGHINTDELRSDLDSLRTILNKYSHGVRSSFFSEVFNDSLDEYDSLIESNILDEVYKESKYSAQDVVLISSNIASLISSLINTKVYIGTDRDNLIKMLESMYTLVQTYKE